MVFPFTVTYSRICRQIAIRLSSNSTDSKMKKSWHFRREKHLFPWVKNSPLFEPKKTRNRERNWLKMILEQKMDLLETGKMLKCWKNHEILLFSALIFLIAYFWDEKGRIFESKSVNRRNRRVFELENRRLDGPFYLFSSIYFLQDAFSRQKARFSRNFFRNIQYFKI